MTAARRLAAIMFTDMVGFSASTQVDEAGTLKLLREEEDIVRPLLATHHGREIKSTGDGFLIEFESALHAVQCAIDIHQRLHERNAQSGVEPIKLRIGIHLGDVEERGSDIFGDAVNIASRIEPLAAPQGVCISGEVYNQVRNKMPNHFEKLEPKTLKNIRAAVDVYRVLLPWDYAQSAAGDVPRSRIAVLPLANISPDPKDEYFADGLTEELISSLSKIRDLRVIARTSVGQYKSTSKSVSQIGSELRVGSVLEGSVRKAGNRLRITLQLIDVGNEEHLWANTFDRDLDDVFAIQTEIAEQTAGALRLELLGAERESITRMSTTNLTAYHLFLRGIHYLRGSRFEAGTPGAEAIKFFEAAIREDPRFSRAYSQLANVLVALAGQELAPREAFPRAKELISKALELDPNSADAHAARGNLAFQYELDWTLAESEFQKAIALNPSNSVAHFWYGVLLTVVQRFDEATEQVRTASELDPLWEMTQVTLAMAQTMSGDFASGISSGKELRDRHPGSPSSRLPLTFIYAYAGRMEEARNEATLTAGNLSWHDRHERALIWAVLGRPEEARIALAEMEAARASRYVSPVEIAALYAALGEKEKALEWLETDFQEGDRVLWFSYLSIAFDGIRTDPRFRSMVERLNLPSEGSRKAAKSQ